MVTRPSAITKLSDTVSDGKCNWMIYGDPGSGKTPLSGTAPNALFLTVEAAGTESAKIAGSTADEWPTPTWEEFGKAYKWLSEGGCKEYKWVIIDSFSEVEDVCWQDHLDTMNREKGRSIYKPQLDDYQIIGNKLKRIVDQFNRLPINVIYTAHVQRVDITDIYTDEESTLIMPAIGSPKNGTLAQKIAGKMTLTGLLADRPKKKSDADMPDLGYDPRRLITQGNRKLLAKNRHGFPRSIDIPSIPMMIEMMEKLEGKQDSDA